MSSENTIQYSFRLNLKNPDHLLIHQTLMNLNPDVYCSMSMYMIDCILKDIKGHDIIAVVASYFLALWVRFDGSISNIESQYIPPYLEFIPF